MNPQNVFLFIKPKFTMCSIYKVYQFSKFSKFTKMLSSLNNDTLMKSTLFCGYRSSGLSPVPRTARRTPRAVLRVPRAARGTRRGFHLRADETRPSHLRTREFVA